MSAPPTRLYFVTVRTAPGDGLRYRERGGGKFTSLAHARVRKAQVLQQHPDATVRILEALPEWEVVE